MWLALLNKVFKADVAFIDPNDKPFEHFNKFSVAYIAILEFVKLLFLSLKKDLTVFMKLGFLGATCVILMITFVIVYGIISLSNTKFEFRSSPGSSETNGLLW